MSRAALPLPPSINSRIITNVNGLNVHILEAGFDSTVTRPLLLLLHGFPELAYSWRKVIEPLSLTGSGYHVVVPDQRGYGRTTGWDETDFNSFRMTNLVTDIVALVIALGYHTVECVIGHDFGSPIAAYCALIRPDMFHSVVMMSGPFPGPPSFPPPHQTAASLPHAVIAQQLLALDPPRKHYQHYYSPPSLQANRDIMQAPQGLHAFLRAYFHMKSADWAPNAPHRLDSWTAQELAKMPEYYIMRADKTMAETVAPHLPAVEAPWLTDVELSVFVGEYSQTTFQGALNHYQLATSPQPELYVFAGKRIEVPALYLAGEKDWGIYQAPGALEKMQDVVCEKMRPGDKGCCIVKGAGHWVQQEQPEEVIWLLSRFLAENRSIGNTGYEK
ncbi:putative epoxide hydrolase [Ramaria rubella]|nr:putative epoxide hydrolase [Ramaria rubella]